MVPTSSVARRKSDKGLSNKSIIRFTSSYFNVTCSGFSTIRWDSTMVECKKDVRSVRKLLAALLREQTLDDESLPTSLMCEIKSIMNGRPLTNVSNDPRDLEALTPNHLLLLRSGPIFPPGVFKREDCYSWRTWRQIQYLADQFWRRWTSEYLLLL